MVGYIIIFTPSPLCQSETVKAWLLIFDRLTFLHTLLLWTEAVLIDKFQPCISPIASCVPSSLKQISANQHTKILQQILPETHHNISAYPENFTTQASWHVFPKPHREDAPQNNSHNCLRHSFTIILNRTRNLHLVQQFPLLCIAYD